MVENVFCTIGIGLAVWGVLACMEECFHYWSWAIVDREGKISLTHIAVVLAAGLAMVKICW